MRRLKNPLQVYYVSPTGHETLFCTLNTFDDFTQTFYGDVNRAMSYEYVESIKRGDWLWLRVQGELPTVRRET